MDGFLEVKAYQCSDYYKSTIYKNRPLVEFLLNKSQVIAIIGQDVFIGENEVLKFGYGTKEKYLTNIKLNSPKK